MKLPVQQVFILVDQLSHLPPLPRPADLRQRLILLHNSQHSCRSGEDQSHDALLFSAPPSDKLRKIPQQLVLHPQSFKLCGLALMRRLTILAGAALGPCLYPGCRLSLPAAESLHTFFDLDAL